MRSQVLMIVAAAFAAASVRSVSAEDVSDLRLVPFPKRISLRPERFALDRQLVLEAPAGVAGLLRQQIGDELRRAGLRQPEVRVVGGRASFWRLAEKPGGAVPAFQFRDRATAEDYSLEIRPGEIICGAPVADSPKESAAFGGSAGLFYGLQTLCQHIRANRKANALPCLKVEDWPSLRWRCFQDDLTRGPSSRPRTLQREVGIGSGLKMNLFTYYMEYQYAFKKHPVIGPKDGSLTPEELKGLVAFAKPLHVDILGNQQSFGHFTRILAHKQYAHLRETGYLLCPVKEESYQLLDDLYSEVVPLLPFPFFNVCCDETGGLGKGPSKELAGKIGVGGVYVRHIRRLHDLLRDKYGKRMMMWGDIILRHPDHLKEVPLDTIMLTWGYGAGANFEKQIIPFAKSGYAFFVCPGVSNWSRILPDFGVATTNIRHFVRDGAKHGALGMLNTAWEDDGEAINAPKWHGYAWGAECAWNASTTSPDDFNRRIGAVLFGESGDHFGRAIELLAQTHRLPGMQAMNNRRFWMDDFTPRTGAAKVRASAAGLLQIVRPAIRHLEACKREAAVNAELLDAFLFGARRMERIGQRMLDGLATAQAYAKACDAPPAEAVALLDTAQHLVRKNRDAHEALGGQFRQLWLQENKPYALDWTMRRYQTAIQRYEDLAAKLDRARASAEAGKALPRPDQLGLAMPEAPES